MLLKRKRSANILSSPTSEPPSNPNTVQSFYPHTKPVLSPSSPSVKSSSFDPDTPSYLDIRTRKRYRDNRPDPDSIHASTLERLYEAQRQNLPSRSPAQQNQNQEQQQFQYQPLPSQKSTLHSFWRIEQPIPIATRIAVVVETRCEDCDGALKDEGVMDVDEGSVEDKACGSCRRPVCDGCAVFGRERVCAGCAGCERGW